MLKNFIKIFILSITLTTILYSSEDLFLKKKIQIEDKFRGQVNLNPDLFKVWIGTRQEANINSKYQIKKKAAAKTNKEYIPGLPTIPSAPKSPSTSNPYSEFPYVVYVYIDEGYNTEHLKNRMRGEIIEVWREINFCEECVNFIPLKFRSEEVIDIAGNGTQALFSPEMEERLSAAEKTATALEATMLELQEIKDANIAQERTIELQEYEISQQQQKLLDEQFLELEEQLNELQTENKEKDSALEDMKIFRMQYLEEQYKMHSFFKDSLLTRYGQKLDNIYDRKIGCLDKRALNFDPSANADCDGCCRYDQESPLYNQGCMDQEATNYSNRYTEPCADCCTYDIEGCMDDTATNYNENANIDNGNCVYEQSNWMIWLMIGLLGALVMLSLFTLLNNKKKVVYLKPKEDGNQSGENPTESGNNNLQPPAPPQYTPTAAPMDEGVLQSEIRTQRQSAVAMSAGQKEGATQIIKDWLDESKNEEQSEE